MYKYYKEIKSGSSFGNNNNSDNKRYCYYRVDEDSECRHLEVKFRYNNKIYQWL